ncbi:hypothetical protein [Methylobacterium sp. SD21]|uniref:hypothetical protein n=1 Tax=Methylobacterium litchii TaxID=3138810 RepID=UPI00313D0B16
MAGIPAALAEADLEDLYAIERALQDARNGILEIALHRHSCAEGRRLVAEHRRCALSAMQEGGPTE